MKGVILVGGLGTRLRPLTCNTPKPMLPLVNRPFIETMITRLRDSGIDEIILAVQYLAERFVETLGDGSRLGVKLHIVEEPEPRGTAGAVKNVEHLLDGTTFIFNGDVMTDLDLQSMLSFHRERGAKVTIALTPVEDPTQFGLVEMDANGSVQRFLEKPRPEEITTNLINAGTYIVEPEIFDLVPANQFYMFERGLFPSLLQRGDPMFGFPSKAYWTDIGKPQTYLEVHHDILIGKAHMPISGKEIAPRVWAEGEVQIAPGVELVGPIVIGAGTRIDGGAKVIGPTVIGKNVEIGAEAVVEGAVIWDNNVIGPSAHIHHAMIGSHNQIGAHTTVSEGAIVSDQCAIGPENRLERGIRLWPGTHLGERAVSF